MFSTAQLPRIAVVYANNKSNSSAVIHATINTRHFKSYQPVAEDICNSLKNLGLDAMTMPDGADLVQRLKDNDIELVWLNTGGVQGECPMAQTPAALETAGIPYIGHSPLNAALLDDKGMFKLACSGLGLPTAPFMVHSPSAGRFNPRKSTLFRSAFGSYKGPFIVKPVTGRASQNVEFVESVSELPEVVAVVGANTNTTVLIEKYLAGREFCIAVMGGGPAGALAFSPVERHLEADEKVFTSMDVKAITTDRVRPMDEDLEVELVSRLQELGEAVYSSFNLTTLVRLDIRADDNGELWILEANPKPDLKRPSATSTSLVCTGLQAQMGWRYEDLVACLFVERLWQLETCRPYMLAHFLPQGVTAAGLLELLPQRVQQVLAPKPTAQLSLGTSASLDLGGLRELSVLAARANVSFSSCRSGVLALQVDQRAHSANIEALLA